MKLLGVHRVHYRKGGAEAVHLDHLELFRERGWTCAEFASVHHDNIPSQFSSYFPQAFDDTANSLAGMVQQIPRFVYNRQARDSFANLLDDFKPDIIHCHGFYHHLTPSILRPAIERGIPFVYTLHDFKLICPTYHFFTQQRGVCEKCAGGRQWNCAFNRCTNHSLGKDIIYATEGLVQRYVFDVMQKITSFVGPSQFIVDKFIEHGVAENRIRTIPNFFETTDDRPVAEPDLADAQNQFGRFVLYFGRLSVEKGIDRLIRAAAANRFRVVIAGDGPAANDLKSLAARSDADIHFPGHLAGSRLWALVETAACIVLPSLWYENAPKSILEAQARGKIVICSDIGGLPELIDHGRTGFLVPPDNVAKLESMLAHVIALDEGSCAMIGDAARSDANSKFTRERYYRETNTLYQELIAANAKNQPA